MAIQAAQIERSRKRLATLLADAMGRPLAEVEEMIEHDLYCNAQEALELGLIDAIGGQGLLAAASPPKDAPPKDAPSKDGTDVGV